MDAEMTNLKRIAYVRKIASKPDWYTVSPKDVCDAECDKAWAALALCATEVKRASYSMRFARFA